MFSCIRKNLSYKGVSQYPVKLLRFNGKFRNRSESLFPKFIYFICTNRSQVCVKFPVLLFINKLHLYAKLRSSCIWNISFKCFNNTDAYSENFKIIFYGSHLLRYWECTHTHKQSFWCHQWNDAILSTFKKYLFCHFFGIFKLLFN